MSDESPTPPESETEFPNWPAGLITGHIGKNARVTFMAAEGPATVLIPDPHGKLAENAVINLAALWEQGPKSIKATIQLKKRYIIEVGGKRLSGFFREMNHMDTLTLFRNEKGDEVIMEGMDALQTVLANVLGDDGDPVPGVILRASEGIQEEIKQKKKGNTHETSGD